MSAEEMNVEASVTMNEEVRARPQTSALLEQGFEEVSSQHGSETCSREGKGRHRVVLSARWAVGRPDTELFCPQRDDARRSTHVGEGRAPEVVADASPPFTWADVPEMREGLYGSAHVERGGREGDGRAWDVSGRETGGIPNRDEKRWETNRMAYVFDARGWGPCGAWGEELMGCAPSCWMVVSQLFTDSEVLHILRCACIILTLLSGLSRVWLGFRSDVSDTVTFNGYSCCKSCTCSAGVGAVWLPGSLVRCCWMCDCECVSVVCVACACVLVGLCRRVACGPSHAFAVFDMHICVDVWDVARFLTAGWPSRGTH